MPDHDTSTAMDRIDAAIARIDGAVARRADATEHLRQRHEALRARMQEAVDALDAVIARGGSALMAEVTLNIGGRPHTLACRDGEEAHLLKLGKRLDAEWATADRAAGGLNSERAMLFLALIMADSLDEAERRPPGEGAGEATLMRVADKLEKLATALEQNPAGA